MKVLLVPWQQFFIPRTPLRLNTLSQTIKKPRLIEKYPKYIYIEKRLLLYFNASNANVVSTISRWQEQFKLI